MLEIKFFPQKEGQTIGERWAEIECDLRARLVDGQVLVGVNRVASLKQGTATAKKYGYTVVYEIGRGERAGKVTQSIDVALALELLSDGYVGKPIIHGRLYFLVGAKGVSSMALVQDST